MYPGCIGLHSHILRFSTKIGRFSGKQKMRLRTFDGGGKIAQGRLAADIKDQLPVGLRPTDREIIAKCRPFTERILAE